MKKLGPRLSDEAAKWYETNFDTCGGGAEYVLEAFPTLYRYALAELRGKFSAAELSLMLDVVNSTALTAGIAGRTLAANVEDGIALDRLDTKWQIHDAPDFISRMQALSPLVLACLEIWSRAFWESGAWEKDCGLEKWVAQIAEIPNG